MQTLLGLRFLPFPGPSSSGDQVLGECSRPQLEPATYRLLRPFRSVFWVYNRRAFSGVSLLGSWFLAATLPADVNRPESQEVLVSNEVC